MILNLRANQVSVCSPLLCMLKIWQEICPELEAAAWEHLCNEKNSVALCHQITTLDRSKLEEPSGTIPAPLLQQIEKALLTAVAISQ